jgi:formiminotetrahydrofolate cyclodeaminase
MYAAAQAMRERPLSARPRSLTLPIAELRGVVVVSKRGTLFDSYAKNWKGSGPFAASYATSAAPRSTYVAGSRLRPANPLRVESLSDYLERLASREAVPGGGSAAALVGALGAALAAMVARIGATDGALAREADQLRAQLIEAQFRDESAFRAVVAAQALPKGNDGERAARRSALESALNGAAEAPLHAASLALAVLKLSERVFDSSTAALVSDAGCAAEFANAAVLACAYNVRINHRYMKDAGAIARQSAALAAMEEQSAQTLARLRERLEAALAPRSKT